MEQQQFIMDLNYDYILKKIKKTKMGNIKDKCPCVFYRSEEEKSSA